MTETPATTTRARKRPRDRRKAEPINAHRSGPKRAAIYARFSVMADNKLSHHAQVQTNTKRAIDAGYEIADTYVDEGKSAGYQKHRPEYERMREDIRAGKIDVVLVTRLDRLTRSTIDFHDLFAEMQEHGVELSTAEGLDFSDKTTGKLLMTLLVVLAEIERANIVERNTAIAKHRRANDMVGGVAPYGYRKVGSGPDARFEIDPAQAKVIRDLVKRVMAGQSLRSLVKHLNDSGVPVSPNAKLDRWTYPQVRHVLNRPAICGQRDDPDERDHFVPAPWEPIISVEQWEAMRDELSSAKRVLHGGNHSDRPVNLLSGLITCGRCGSKMRPRRQSNGKLRYQCTTSHLSTDACGGPSVLADDAESEVVGRLFRTLTIAGHGRPIPPATRRDDERAAAIEAEIDEIEHECQMGRLNLPQYKGLMAEARSRLAQVEREAQIDRRDSNVVKLIGSGGKIEQTWPTLTIEAQRALLRAVFPVIKCRNNGRQGLRVPIVDRIETIDATEIDIELAS